MNLVNFELFCTVAQVKSITKAAKLLHMTQPAVSTQIANLENAYGIKLFERSKQGVTLTEVGEVVFDFAQRMLDLHDTMERKIDSVLDSNVQELVVGASSSLGNYAVPCSIWSFKEKYPKAKISLIVANTEEIVKKVRNDSVDVGLIEGPLKEDSDLVANEISNDELVAVVPGNDRWLNKTYLTIEDFKKEPFISREEGSGVRKVLEASIEKLGLKLTDFNVVSEMGSVDAIKSSIENGLGISICCRLTVQKEVRRGSLKAIPIENLSMPITYRLLFRKTKFRATIAKRFIRFMVQPDLRSFC